MQIVEADGSPRPGCFFVNMAIRKLAWILYAFVLTELVGLFIKVSEAKLLNSTVEPPGGECEIRFMQDLFTCFTNAEVPFNTYLFVVGNKTGGIPPDDEVKFKQEMCGVEDNVVDCVLLSLHTLADTPQCQEADGMERLLTVQVRTIFEEYDNYCAHECRKTLKNSMKQCYSKYGLDPSLFMTSDSDGAILGKTSSSVTEFCINQEGLMSCLVARKDACPEAAFVLKSLNLNLDTFRTGLKLLCRQPDVYLSSLDCFGRQTRAVEKCQEDNGLALMRLVSRARTEASMNQETFLKEFCLARVQFIKCDMTAWAAKSHEACDSPALALKRDVHCSQVPLECVDLLQEPIQEVCAIDWATASDANTGTPSAEPGWKHLFLFWAAAVSTFLWMDSLV